MGFGLVLPAVLLSGRLLSRVLPVLPELRIRCAATTHGPAPTRRGGAVYGPYGGAGYGARYNPTTGTWARGAAAYGPAGARGAIQAYNPRTGAVGSTIQGSNVYGSWGSTAVRRGDQWAQTSRVTRNATGTTGRVTQGSRRRRSVHAARPARQHGDWPYRWRRRLRRP